MQRPDLAPLSCVNVECGRNEMDPCAVKTVPWNEGSICISASRIESISATSSKTCAPSSRHMV
jgi:hypothetical protein